MERKAIMLKRAVSVILLGLALGNIAPACNPNAPEGEGSSEVASAQRGKNFDSKSSPAKLNSDSKLEYEPLEVVSGVAYYGIEGVYNIANIFREQKIDEKLESGDQVAFVKKMDGDCRFSWVGNYSLKEYLGGYWVTIKCADAEKYLHAVDDAHSCISTTRNACSEERKLELKEVHDSHVRLKAWAAGPFLPACDGRESKDGRAENPYQDCKGVQDEWHRDWQNRGRP